MRIIRNISEIIMKGIRTIGLLIGFVSLTVSCSKDDPFKDADPQFQRIDIPGTKPERLHIENKTLPFKREKSSNGTHDNYSFTLRYLLEGPSVNGVKVQASHIKYRQDNLYITYNTAGPEISGGFDRLDLTVTGTPQLTAIGTNVSEYSSVEVITDPSNGYSRLILAGVGMGIGAEPLPQIQIFNLSSSGVPDLNPTIRILNGYVATDINELGIVTGTQGGFYQIGSIAEGSVNYLSDLDDARSIAFNPETHQFVALLGNPGRLITGLPDAKNVISLGGLGLAEAKAIVRIHNGFAIAALGEGGIKVINLSTGSITASLPRPEAPAGSNPDNYVTNGVSIDASGRIYIANGAAGVMVGQLGSDGNLELLGCIDLDASVNFVESVGGFLYAACGSRGVAIIQATGLTSLLPDIGPVGFGEISGTTASVHADVRSDGGKPVLSRGFCWSYAGIPTNSDNKSMSGSGTGIFSGILSGLDPNKKYFVRAFATTINGTSYSDVATFNTPDPNGVVSTFTDSRDGHIYKYLQMGSQTWMAENLAWLPQVNWASSGSTSTPYYYVYGYHGQDVSRAKQTESYEKYGVLYNQYAALSACPDGWHLPSDNDWKQLEQFLGMNESDVDKERFRYTGSVGTRLKAQEGWNSQGNGYENGFNALPGGYRKIGGSFEDQGSFGAFWTSTSVDYYGTYRSLFNFNSGVYRSSWYSSGGFSVRCLKN